MQRSNPAPGDDLDRLLHAFYQAEMPNPWPAPAATLSRPTVLSAPAAPTTSPGLWNSRFALAASVAVLVSGSVLLSGSFRNDGSRPLEMPVGGLAVATRPNSALFSNFEIIEEEVKPILGQTVRIAPIQPALRKNNDGLRTIAKPVSRDTVGVSAMPLDDGSMKIVVEYYPKGADQPIRLTCQGSASEIEKSLQDATELTPQQRELARAALERVRSSVKPRPESRAK